MKALETLTPDSTDAEVSRVVDAYQRVALCDCCDQRPGVRTVFAAGCETWVCEPCSEWRP
jgi:hypothetical protein